MRRLRSRHGLVEWPRTLAARRSAEVAEIESLELFHAVPKPLTSLPANERQQQSPRITALAWGRIQVEGFGEFRDAKVFPGGAREWDWNETGTAHEPGVQPADVAELIDHGATTIVLSRGRLKRLHICPQTLRLLQERGVRAHVLPTAAAVALYNQLREREQVAGLFHTTC